MLIGSAGVMLPPGGVARAAMVTVGLDTPALPTLSEGEQERLSALQAVQRPHILSDLSPDGRTLVVSLDSGVTPDQRTLWFLDLPTGALREAPELEYDVVSPLGPLQWVDNDTLRFVQQDLFGPWEMVTLNRATGIVSRMQVSPVGEEAGEILGVSPDFSKLAIRVYEAEEDVVFLVSLDTLQRLEVARIPKTFSLQPPSWSASGDQVAFVTTAIDTDHIYDRSPYSPSLASALVQDALGRTPPEENPLRQHNRVRVLDLTQTPPLRFELQADLSHGDGFAAATLSPDGQRLLVKRYRPAHLTGRPYPTYLFPDSAYYQVYDGTGTLTDTITSPALQGPLDSQGWFLGADRLLFWAAHGHNRPLWVYDLTQDRIDRLPLPPGSVDPLALALSPDGDTVVYGFSSVTQPPELFRIRPGDTVPPEPLTQINDALQRWNRVQYQPVQFATAQGNRPGFLVQPAGQAFPPQRVPIVFWQEGGPGFSMANAFLVDVEAPLNLLPNFGLAVLVVPLTGREGFGPAVYRAQADGENFGHIDIAEGREVIQQVVQRGWAQPSQMGVSGCSYGGYFAVQSLRQYPDLFAAANPQCTLLDTLTEWQLGYSSLLAYLMGQSPMENPSAYLERSPLYGADTIRTPTIMFHGSEDFLPIDIARNFHDLLDDAGAEVTLYAFEGTGHGITDPYLQHVAAQIQIAFFRQYLRP